MLTELFHTGLQTMQVVGLLIVLWGVFLLIGAMGTGQGPIGWSKGVLLMLLGCYLMAMVRAG